MVSFSSLYSVCCAPAVFQMSTECAFRVLNCIMSKFHLRDLFAVGLSGLKLRLFQLTKLIQVGTFSFRVFYSGTHSHTFAVWNPVVLVSQNCPHFPSLSWYMLFHGAVAVEISLRRCLAVQLEVDVCLYSCVPVSFLILIWLLTCSVFCECLCTWMACRWINSTLLLSVQFGIAIWW